MDLMKKLTTAACWCLSLALPVKKNRVVFCSYYGRGYSDNPKAIAQAMLDMGTDAELIWLLKNPEDAKSLPAGITPCPYDSAKRIWALATAKVWVDNCRKYERFKRKNQYYLQTWHGFALKRIEQDAAQSLDQAYIDGSVRDASQTDLIVSGSGFMTKLYQNSFWYHGLVQNWGTPRNDVFFHPDPALRSKVRSFFGLSEECNLLLYAPTFRADHATDCYALDAAAALESCRRRFGGSWAALIRLHPNVAHQSAGLFAYDGTTILDATAYPDMQELLPAVDLLITDYSSSMFDYALQEKPCIQFALDIDRYKKDRNFYFPLDELPFPLARSNRELCEKIESYDPQLQHQRWERFRRDNGFCEDGLAAHRCARWILEQLES